MPIFLIFKLNQLFKPMKKPFTKWVGACCSLILLTFLSTTNLSAQYCDFAGTTPASDHITNVTFAGIDNSSAATGYSDFTAISGTVVPAVSYDISVTMGNADVWTETLTVYIDWNQNQVFDAEERYDDFPSCTSGGCGTTGISGSIDVPAGAIPGETTMRVIGKFNTPPVGPCNSDGVMTFGEVEDYSLIVQSGVCTPPTLTYDVINDCVADTYSVSSVIEDYGTNTFVTIIVTRSDEVPASNVNLLAVAIPPGSTVPIINNVPFGVSVSLSIEGQNPICNLTRNFIEEICPAENDEACDAIGLVCDDVLTDQPFVGATQSIDDACGGAGTADVWYSFTTDGSEKYNIAETSSADVVVGLYSADDCNALTPVVDCQDFPENFLVTEPGTYYFRVRSWNGTNDFHGVTLTCIPFDCPELTADFGSACDDGDPLTYVDVLQDDCSCAGFVPVPGQICEVPLEISTLPYNTTDNTSNYFDDYESADFPPLAPGATVNGSTTGAYIGGDDVVYSYTPDNTESLNLSVTEHGTWAGVYIFTGCPFASTVAGFTTSSATIPLTINGFVAQAGVTYYIVISTWPAPQSTPYTLDLEAVPFDCPAIPSNFGAPCDDGNPETSFDEITEDCICAGIPSPANDDCADAEVAVCGGSYSGSTIASAPYAAGQPFCETPAPTATNGGVWYSYTPTNDTDIDIDLSGSDFDTKLFLYSGTCEALVCVDGDDDGGDGLDSRIQATLTGGTDYLIFVTGIGTARGDFVMNVSCVDLVCSPTIESVTLVNSEGTPVDCANIGGNFYLEVTLAGGTQTSYNVSAGDSPETVINADATGIVGPISTGNVTVSAVGSTDSNCGASQAFEPSICPPTNDLPCDAIAALNDGSVTFGSNIGASADEGEIAPPQGGCATDSTWCDNFAGTQGSVDNSVWFTFVGPETGRVRIDGCNDASTFDSQFAVYTASDCNDYSTFELVGANDDQPFGIFGTCSSGSFRAGLDLCIEPGVTYYLQVDGYAGAEGTFGITIEGIDAAACSCEPPVVPAVFTFADTAPYCEDGVTGYTLNFYSPEDLGSSEFFVYSYSYVPGDTIVVNVPAGGTVAAEDIIPLGTPTSITITLSDENCAEANTGFPISGAVVQNDAACDPDCEGTPGGQVGPDSPCDIDGVGGFYNDECECIPSPVNDECADALPLVCGETYSGSTASSAPYAEGQLFCGTPAPTVGNGGVWYVITPENNTDVILDLTGSTYDTKIFLYAGTCDDLVCVDGDDDGGVGTQSLLEATLSAGTTYYIFVTGFSASSGDYTLNSTCTVSSVAAFNGTVGWNSNCDDRISTVTFYEPNTSNVAATYETTVNSAGEFTIPSVLVGTYDIIVDVPGHLNKGLADVVTVVGDNAVDFGPIRGGDANDNNSINIADFSGLNAAFGSVAGDANYNLFADFNCSGTINIADFSGLNAGFGQGGANAPLP